MTALRAVTYAACAVAVYCLSPATAQPVENLLSNHAFARGILSPADWSFNEQGANRVAWETAENGAVRSILLKGSGDDWAGLTGQRIEATPGETLTVGAIIRVEPGSVGSDHDRLFVRFARQGRFVSQSGPGLGSVGTAWQVVAGVVVVPQGTDMADFSLQVWSSGSYRVASAGLLRGDRLADVPASLGPPPPADAQWRPVLPRDVLPEDADANGLPDSLERFLAIATEHRAVSARRTRHKTTSLQTPTGYREDNDLKVDAIIVAGNAESSIRSWALFGYEPHVMVGFRAGPDYLTGTRDDILGKDEVQTAADGTLLTCGPGSYYMVPTENRRRIFRQYFADAVSRGARAACPEEPEFFARAGYSQAFKREWQAHYQEPWQDPASSVVARYKASRLAVVLERKLLQACYEGARSADSEVSRFLLTHSPLNYASWGIVFGHQDMLATGEVDAMVAQVWTGTARSAVPYQGVRSERTFENGYLEYASCLGLTIGTDTDLWFLMDPLEDNPDRSMEDYLSNYKRTLAAALLFPEVVHYETMPWPTRIFGRVPDDFATVIGTVINVLSDMANQTQVAADMGPSGIGVFLSDTAMWQRGAPSPTSLDGLYGLALPLLMRGIPVAVPCLDRADEPGYLDRYRLLLLSYELIKPLRPDINRALAEWVASGGHLLVFGGDDPYNAVPEWWRRDGLDNPTDHLLSLCGMDPARRSVLRGAGDSEMWQPVATTDYSGHEVDLSRQQTVEIDLTPYIAGGTALIKCEDSIKDDGFGALITAIRVQGVRRGKPFRAEVTPDTPAEHRIIAAECDTGFNHEPGYRFCDRDGYVVYRFDLDPGTRATLQLEIGNQYIVSARAADRSLDRSFTTSAGAAPYMPGSVTLSPVEPLVSYTSSGATPLYSGSAGDLVVTRDHGSGSLLYCGRSPAVFAQGPEAAEWLRSLVRLCSEGSERLPYREQGYMLLERGPYTIARTLHGSLALSGPFIDLLDARLPVRERVNLGPDDLALLLKLPDTPAAGPGLLYSSSCVEWSSCGAREARLILSGARGTTGSTRLRVGGQQVASLEAVDVRGNSVSVEQTADQGTLLLRYPNQPLGMALRVRWQ